MHSIKCVWFGSVSVFLFGGSNTKMIKILKTKKLNGSAMIFAKALAFKFEQKVLRILSIDGATVE